MRYSHCIWALAALLIAPVTAQAPQSPTTTHAYIIFLRGTAIGREEVTVASSPGGTTISSQGRTAIPLETILQRMEVRYNAQGSPESLVVDGLIDGSASTVRTNVRDGSATTITLVQGKNASVTQRISPDAVVLPSGVFGSFAALLPKLRATPTEGAEFRLFLVPSTEVSATLSGIRTEQMQTGTTIFDVRRYDLAIGNAAAPILLRLTTAPDGSLLRIAIPAQSLDVLREDIAGANTRTSVHSNPGDHLARIPALGFTLGATMTLPSGMAAEAPEKPRAQPPPTGSTGPGTRTASVASARPEPVVDPTQGVLKRPAVILVSGRGSPDRDAISLGAPAMAELAGALAQAGFVAVRYDNRGVGQSGGRTESATLEDYAGDVRAAVKWLADRKDIDAKRIAIVGHGEGAWMAMLAASLERVAAVVTLGAPASTGEQLVLDQQRTELEALAMSDAERAAKQALQKQVHAAVLSGRGWDQLPPDLRRRADTPWFRSVLEYDPGKVIGRIRAPILVVHGEVDREIPVEQAERLAELARKGKSDSVELVVVRGVNHQLTPALTGSVREYPMLSDRGLSPDVSSTVTSWLARVLPAPRGR